MGHEKQQCFPFLVPLPPIDLNGKYLFVAFWQDVSSVS